MKKRIEDLEIGKADTLEIVSAEARKICKRINGKFRVITTGSNSCIVWRLDPGVESLHVTVMEAIDGLGVFDSQRIDGDVQYIRSIVSRFNNKNDREIRVNKVNGVATISEFVMARKEITKDEFNEIKVDFDTKLEILRGRIVDD